MWRGSCTEETPGSWERSLEPAAILRVADGQSQEHWQPPAHMQRKSLGSTVTRAWHGSWSGRLPREGWLGSCLSQNNFFSSGNNEEQPYTEINMVPTHGNFQAEAETKTEGPQPSQADISPKRPPKDRKSSPAPQFQGAPESGSPPRAWRQPWVSWMQLDEICKQAAMLQELLTGQHSIQGSLVI